MVDTAGTLCKAADKLKANGARRVYAFASHAVMSGPAASRIAHSSIDEVVVLDTIPLTEQCVVSTVYNNNFLVKLLIACRLLWVRRLFSCPLVPCWLRPSITSTARNLCLLCSNKGCL